MVVRRFLELNNEIDPLLYIGSALFFGILFASVNNSLPFILIFLIGYGLITFILCSQFNVYWDVGLQLALFCGYLLGWLIGRNIIEDENPISSLENFNSQIKKWLKLE